MQFIDACMLLQNSDSTNISQEVETEINQKPGSKTTMFLPTVENKTLEALEVTFLFKDYSKFPSLQGMPREGDIIAYKVINWYDSL